MKLAIIITHPIQYYSPVFQMLAETIELKVFYTAMRSTYDPDFRLEIQWDIPLLDGYNYAFTNGAAAIPAITAFNPSHLLVYGWSPAGHVKILRHFKNKAHILFRGDSVLLKEMSKWKSIIKQVILKKVFSYVDTALYVGTNNRLYFLKYGLKPHQLVFAPHAIDNKRFSSLADSRFLRSSLGISNDDTLVLFAGKFTKNKNPLLLLRAFKCLNYPHAHLLFVGGGKLTKQLRKEAEGHRIHVWPFQNQQHIPLFYQACDLFCLPSNNESWGLAINEAMACGKAVLISEKCGAAADLVHDNGVTFTNGNYDDLQKKLGYYLSNPALLKIAGISSRKIIRNWSFQVQVQSILKAISS